MRRFWVFKNAANFTLATLSCSVLGYFGYFIYKENLMQSPVIDESIFVMSRNSQIRGVIGNPISYKSQTNSDILVNDQQAFFSFPISGPKGILQAELIAESKLLKDVYNPPGKQSLSSQIDKKKSELEAVKELLTTRSQNPPKKIDLAVYKKQIENLQLQKTTLQNQYNDLQTQYFKLLWRSFDTYYIPDKSQVDLISQQSDKTIQIPQNFKMWGITKLIAELPNKNQIIVIPATEKIFTEQQLRTSPSPWTYQSLQNKLSKKTEIIDSDQIVEYSKYKTNNMYMKYSSYRWFGLLSSLLLVGAIIIYRRGNKFSRMDNSILVYEFKRMVASHPKFRHFKSQWIWNPSISGGQSGNDINMELRSIAPVKGILSIQSIYDPKLKKYNTTLAEFKVFDQKPEKSQIVNLLKAS